MKLINLLPPQEKQVLGKEKEFRQILILSLIVLLSISFLIIILFLARIDLEKKVMSQREILSRKTEKFEASEVKKLEKEIFSLNELVLELNSFYKDQSNLTAVLEELSETLPAGAYFTNLSRLEKEEKISISGFSPTREILLEFKQNLEKSGNFKEVYFPPGTWTKPADIEFLLTFKLK